MGSAAKDLAESIALDIVGAGVKKLGTFLVTQLLGKHDAGAVDRISAAAIAAAVDVAQRELEDRIGAAALEQAFQDLAQALRDLPPFNDASTLKPYLDEEARSMMEVKVLEPDRSRWVPAFPFDNSDGK